MAKTEFKKMSSTVNESNAPSIAMHNRFANSANIKTARQPIDNNRIVYEFDLRNLNKDKLSETVEEVLY